MRSSRVHTIITDDGIETRDAKMIEQAGVRLIVAEVARDAQEKESGVSG